jgi:hypothetical protein
MHDAPHRSVSAAALASALLERASQIAEEMTDRISKQVTMYGDVGLIPRDDLYDSCRDNVEFVFQSLGDGRRHDLSAPRRTGRRRAIQGASLAMVQSAYRIGFSHMWDCVVAEAERSDVVSEGELVRIASDVWGLNEVFTGEMATAYRDAMTEQIVRQDQERSALVEALVQGKVVDTATVWEAADLLGLPYQGQFVVVAAEPPTLAQQALPNIEARMRARDIGSAWRLLPDLHVGVVALRSPNVLTKVLQVLRPVVKTRAGVSPVYTGLENTAQAMHLARIAMASIMPGESRLCVFDDAPVPALVTSSPTTSYRVMKNVLGPLMEIAEDERTALLKTLEAYFAVGSVAGAGERLYCHRNTVRHRLHRIEQLTGRSVDDPLGAVELYVALQIMLRLPAPTE